ncbi:MAG: XkdX family protein [Bacteroidales bacterium]|nr:XkdX family protein [Bacteroidales bacterium]
MTNFEKAKFYYENNYCDETGLQRWVSYNFISHAEYYTITKDKLFLKSEVVAGKLSVIDYEAITGEVYVA